MLFSSMVFLWCFLPIVLLGCFLLKPGLRNLFLLCASLIFYAWGEPVYIWLMLVSIALNYVCGLLVAGTSGRIRQWMLWLDVLLNLSLLGYFKYANFFVDTVNQLHPGTIEGFARVALP